MRSTYEFYQDVFKFLYILNCVYYIYMSWNTSYVPQKYHLYALNFVQFCSQVLFYMI